MTKIREICVSCVSVAFMYIKARAVSACNPSRGRETGHFHQKRSQKIATTLKKRCVYAWESEKSTEISMPLLFGDRCPWFDCLGGVLPPTKKKEMKDMRCCCWSDAHSPVILYSVRCRRQRAYIPSLVTHTVINHDDNIYTSRARAIIHGSRGARF